MYQKPAESASQTAIQPVPFVGSLELVLDAQVKRPPSLRHPITGERIERVEVGGVEGVAQIL